MQRALILSPSIGRRGGGVSESARLFTEALVDSGEFEVEVITFHDNNFEKEKENWPNIKINAFKTYGPSNYRFSPGMLKYILSREADIIHVHGIWTFHVLVAALWCVKYRKPALVTPHGMLEPWILRRSVRLKKAVSTLYQDRFLRQSALHVLTQKEKHDVQQAGLPTDRCTIIPNYVNPPRMNLGPPTWWQPEFETRRIYLFFGRIHDKKGWKELCDAWANLCQTSPIFKEQSQLVFCGWPDNCPQFEIAVSDLNSRFGNALFAGPQFGEDRDRSYAAAHIFLLPSKSEGLPMSILEAWSSGLPTIMTRACNLDIGFNTKAAIETTEDAAGIASALQKVATMDTTIFMQHQTSAKSIIDSHFSKNIVGQAYVGQLKEISNA